MSDPVHPRVPHRFAGELFGLGLLSLTLASVFYATNLFPGPNPVTKGTATLAYGMCFLSTSGLLIATYFFPAHGTVFRFISAVFDKARGSARGRPGLLLLGVVFGLIGIYVLTVGFGILG